MSIWDEEWHVIRGYDDEYWEVVRDPEEPSYEEDNKVFDDGSAGREYSPTCTERTRDFLMLAPRMARFILREDVGLGCPSCGVNFCDNCYGSTVLAHKDGCEYIALCEELEKLR